MLCTKVTPAEQLVFIGQSCLEGHEKLPESTKSNKTEVLEHRLENTFSQFLDWCVSASGMQMSTNLYLPLDRVTSAS